MVILGFKVNVPNVNICGEFQISCFNMPYFFLFLFLFFFFGGGGGGGTSRC